MKVKAIIMSIVLAFSMFSLAGCGEKAEVSSQNVSSETAVVSPEESVSKESSAEIDKFDEIVNTFSDALEGKKLDKSAVCDWNGKFVCVDTSAEMTMGQMDSHSFEFTITNGEYELATKVAQVYGNLAVYEHQDEGETFKLAFCMDGDKVYVALNGDTDGEYYGTYTKA